jgi:hypothetical protein
MNSPSISLKNTRSTKGIEPVSIGVVCLLFLGFLGYMGFRNLPAGYKAGGYANMNAVVGEWQAAGRPGHIAFRADKTMGMSSIGSAEPGNMEPGTFQLWTEGNVIIKMKNGREYSATFRELTPNQFDLIDSENGAVTVFRRVP